jgi:hypothetical protein
MKNEKTISFANTFGITLEGAELSLAIQKSRKDELTASSKAKADYLNGHEYLSGVYPDYAGLKFNAVSRCEFGSEKYHEKLTELASEHNISANAVKEIHGFIMSLSPDTKERASMTQSVKRAGVRANKEENEAETTESSATNVATVYEKVIKTLCSQYQHLGKVEAKDESINQLMNDIAQLLVVHGVNLETL